VNIDKRVIIAGAIMIGLLFLWIVWPKGNGQGRSVSSGKTVQELYAEAKDLKENGKLLEAKEVYQSILNEFSDYDKIEAIQKEAEDVNMRIIFSNLPTPESVTHEVQSGDTLGSLAQKYHTTVEFIKKSNYLASDNIRAGQKLRVWTGSFNIFVDKSQNILILKDGDEVVKVYKVATGENNNTPIGNFKIITKLIDPVWFNKGIVVPPESPKNVLGSRWLGFDLAGYGIHGTTEPETIGQQATAGCVRMLNSEVEELYTLTPLGTPVVIVD